MIEIKKLKDGVTKPTPTPSGLDLYATKRVDIEPDQTCKMDSGLSIKISEGYVGILFPKGKMSLKFNARIGAQLVHANHEGEIVYQIHNSGKDLLEIIENKDPILQLVVVPVHHLTTFIGFDDET